MVDYTPYCDSMSWADMAFEGLDEPEPASFIYQPTCEAFSYTFGEQTYLDKHQETQAYPLVAESVVEQRGNNWVARHLQEPWSYLSQRFWDPLDWERSEQSVAILAGAGGSGNSSMMRPWTNEARNDASKRQENHFAADLPPLVSFRQDSLTRLECPSCHYVFTGKYSKGNLVRHLRTKHDTHRRGGRIRHRRLAYSIFLTGAQLACTIPLHSYDYCHGDLTCPPPIASSSILDDLPPYFDFLKHPTTNIFVLSALAYGATAMCQYHINDRDRFQQLCLVIGVTMGFFWSVASPAGLNATSSIIAMAITAALSVSTIGHWMYAMVRGENTRTEAVAVEEKVGNGVV